MPAQTGLLLPAVGAAGVAFTTTVVVPTALVQPETVTVNEYVPAAKTVTPAMFGFCNAEEKLFGPVQLYVAPATAEVVKFKVVPVQTGLLLDGDGVAGIGFTTTMVVPAGPAHPATVAVTEYVPAPKAVTPAMLGFCNADEKLFGPVQLYVAPAILLAVRFKVVPAQTGLLLPAVGATGAGSITTDVVPTALVHPETVSVNE